MKRDDRVRRSGLCHLQSREISRNYSELSRITDPSAAIRGLWSTRASANLLVSRIDLWSSDRQETSPGAGSNWKAIERVSGRGKRSFSSPSRARTNRYVATAASVSVNSEWVVSESPVGVVTRPAIGVIGGSPIVFRSFLLRARDRRNSARVSCNRQNRWRPDVLHDGRGSVIPRGRRGSRVRRRWRARNRTERKSVEWSREISHSSTFR